MAPILIPVIVLVLVVALAAMVTGIFNKLATYRNRYKNAFAQIEVQIKRRYDLIPKLVETAKGYMKHERESLGSGGCALSHWFTTGTHGLVASVGGRFKVGRFSENSSMGSY